MKSLKQDLEIKKAAQLSLTEISLGTLGHAFKIPFTGHILSLNQLAFMLNAINKDQLPISSTFEISGIAAVLKSFSPAGQKLGPMLSITMQGFLFWFFSFITHAHLIGQLLGALFLAIWAFIQHLITYFIIYGFDLVNVAQFYENRIKQDYTLLHQSLLIAFLVVVGLKMMLAGSLVIYSFFTRKEINIIRSDKVSYLVRANFKSSTSKVWLAALKDLLRPLFLISFILMIIFIWQIESSWSQKIWMSLRPLAIAYLLFYFLRSPWISEKLLKLSKKSKVFERIYLKSKAALDLLKVN